MTFPDEAWNIIFADESSKLMTGKKRTKRKEKRKAKEATYKKQTNKQTRNTTALTTAKHFCDHSEVWRVPLKHFVNLGALFVLSDFKNVFPGDIDKW